jgi:hypothetical protein
MEKNEIINQIKNLIKKKFDDEVSLTELLMENSDRFFIERPDNTMFSRACFFNTDNITVNYFIDDVLHPVETLEDDYEKLSIEDLLFLAEKIALF